MSNNIVSIIIPVYNCEKWLSACLDSILLQKMPNGFDMELLLVDDGSTDGSPKISDEYAEKQSERVKVFHQKNSGVSAARNTGLAYANGDWIMFVDADDVLDENTFMLLDDSELRSNDIIRFGWYEFNKRVHRACNKQYCNELKTYIRLVLQRKAALGVCGGFYKRELFNGLSFPEDISIGEDWLTLACLLINAKSFVYVNKNLYGYRINEESVTHVRIFNPRPDVLIALNRIIDLCCAHSYPISEKDIKMARSDIRRNMMKMAIRNHSASFYKKNDEIMKMYGDQTLFSDICYSMKLKHKIGFLLYSVLDFGYGLFSNVLG